MPLPCPSCSTWHLAAVKPKQPCCSHGALMWRASALALRLLWCNGVASHGAAWNAFKPRAKYAWLQVACSHVVRCHICHHHQAPQLQTATCCSCAVCLQDTKCRAPLQQPSPAHPGNPTECQIRTGSQCAGSIPPAPAHPARRCWPDNHLHPHSGEPFCPCTTWYCAESCRCPSLGQGPAGQVCGQLRLDHGCPGELTLQS